MFRHRALPAGAAPVLCDLSSLGVRILPYLLMRIMVYEYLSLTILPDEPGVESLRREGLAMLLAVLTDFAVLDHEVVSLVHSDIQPLIRASVPNVEILSATASTEESAFRHLAHNADAALIIAPELDNLLEERCRWVLEESCLSLGSSLDAIRLTADKWALAEHFKTHLIPTPATYRLDDASRLNGDDWLIKPRYGAGSQGIVRINHLSSLNPPFLRMLNEEYAGERILQREIPARYHASVSFLLGNRQCHSLPPVRQILSDDGRFRYLGGAYPVQSADRERLTTLARRAVQSVPGLSGYVGVDLVVGEDEVYVVEINPRMTTSYVGLRRRCRTNLMDALIKLSQGQEVPSPVFDERELTFTPDGSVR